MKKYIFIALLGLYSCSDDQGIIEGNAPKASFTTDKEEYTVGDKVILTNASEATDSKITSYFWKSVLGIYLFEIKRVRRITSFWGNELATVLIAVVCIALLIWVTLYDRKNIKLN